VGEHRHCQNEIEVTVLDRKRRAELVAEAAQRRTQVGLHPVDAVGVDIATPELSPTRRLGQELAKCSARAATEVEDVFAIKRPIVREKVLDDPSNAPTVG
jgi:hypothetical protein